ncbi:MAG: DUF6356 family protein [Caulobacter sp.]
MNPFTRHPNAVGESYGRHFGVATRFGATMILGGIGAILHGVFPWLFETTGSRTVTRLYQQIAGRGPDLPGADDRDGAGV